MPHFSSTEDGEQRSIDDAAHVTDLNVLYEAGAQFALPPSQGDRATGQSFRARLGVRRRPPAEAAVITIVASCERIRALKAPAMISRSATCHRNQMTPSGGLNEAVPATGTTKLVRNVRDKSAAGMERLNVRAHKPSNTAHLVLADGLTVKDGAVAYFFADGGRD